MSTYPISEVLSSFSLPIEIQLLDPIYSNETKLCSFASGDAFTIVSQVTLHKVAANFYTPRKSCRMAEIPDSANMEILIPLHYNGGLYVKNKIKMYDSFQELSFDFPRYVIASEDIVVTANEGKAVIIQAGSVVELDRMIPGKKLTFKKDPNKLIMRFHHCGRAEEVVVPVTSKGHFRSTTDETKYTVIEAIERYNLPQLVTFVDDEVQRVYTGHPKHVTVSETLKLNRLVTQHVLVGHYWPIGDETTNDTEQQATLIVIPLEDPSIKNVAVKVRALEKVHQSPLHARNMSSDLQYLESSLYVDFASVSGIKRICGYTLSADEIGSSNTLQKHSTRKKIPCKPPEIPARPSPCIVLKSKMMMTNNRNCSECNETDATTKTNESKEHVDYYGAAAPDNIDENISISEEIFATVPNDELSSRREKNVTSSTSCERPLSLAGQPIVEVRPMLNSGNPIRAGVANVKRFDTLTVDELIERLSVCGMKEFAQICSKLQMDGQYASKLTNDDLRQKPYNLTRFQAIKLEKIKDNWIPN